MEAVTYSIRLDDSNSEEYYKDAHNFTDEVIFHASLTITPIAEEFMDYLHTFRLEEVRKVEEYILELISFGVLWNSYSQTALSVKHAPFITMARMAEWRKKHQKAKPFIDFARGIFLTFFLLPAEKEKQNSELPALEQIDHVCKWFEATGEFREQALRFIRWRAFWGTKNSAELKNMFRTIDDFTQWFKKRSAEVFGKYTANVEAFLESSRKRYKWREDRISCTRSPVEYHLNMVGAELMNRAFKSEFENTNSKAVLLPGCIRFHNNNECKSKRVKEGLICEGCTPQCNVNRLREMGKRKGFDVYIIPHASDLSLWSPKPDRPACGVIASACVTTLVEGGWELKRYEVPAQCVLLDYSGCKKHWHCRGVSTGLNVRELKRILSN